MVTRAVDKSMVSLATSLPAGNWSTSFTFIYDNAWLLARFIRNQNRRCPCFIPYQAAHLRCVLDRFHALNHRACLDPSHSLYMPEVNINQYPALKDRNTAWNESWNFWVDNLVPQVPQMAAVSPTCLQICFPPCLPTLCPFVLQYSRPVSSTLSPACLPARLLLCRPLCLSLCPPCVPHFVLQTVSNFILTCASSTLSASLFPTVSLTL